MSETLSFLFELIKVDLVPGFGIYSLLFWLARFTLPQMNWLVELDKSATNMVIYLGVALGILFIFQLSIYYNSLNTIEEIAQFNNRLFGPYAFGFWTQTVFWVLLTQLLRLNNLRQSIIYRLLLSLSFVFSFTLLFI